MENRYELFRKCKVWIGKYKGQFTVLLTIYLVAFWAIIRANFSYVDDIGRTYAGYHGWLDWSRWSTEALATLVHAGWHLTDISPLPQIMACVIMASGGIILLDLFRNEKEVGFWNVVAVSLTGLAPYFLGIISYKFDSPYMALSFSISVVPFLFRNRSKKVYMISSAACLLIMCTTYQASSGIYPMLVLFLSMQDIARGEKKVKVLEFIGISAACYFVSLGLFWILLMRENGVTVPAGLGLVSNLISRYMAYYKMIYSDHTKIWLVLMIIVAAVYVYVICQTTVMRKACILLLGIFSVCVGSGLCFGAYLFISEEAFDTRAMYGFHVFLALMAVYASFHGRFWLSKLPYAALAWSFLIFSLTYGNALVQQKDYMNYRVTLLAGDLNALEIMKTDEIKKIRIEGDIGLAPVIANMSEAYPLLGRSIFTGFGEGVWGGYYFYHYLNMPDIEVVTDENECKDLPLIKDTMYHKINGDSGHILIRLK